MIKSRFTRFIFYEAGMNVYEYENVLWIMYLYDNDQITLVLGMFPINWTEWMKHFLEHNNSIDGSTSDSELI